MEVAPESVEVPTGRSIWDIQKLRLFVVLEQLSPVRSFQWDPQQPRLAICTGGSKVYLWSPAGCVSVQVPGEGEHCPLGGTLANERLSADTHHGSFEALSGT